VAAPPPISEAVADLPLPQAPDPIKPVAKLTGPEQSPPGELCIFSAEGSVGSLEWRCLPKKPMLIGDGRLSAGFATNTQGVYYVVLVAAAGDKSDIAVISLTVGSGPLPPLPVPPAPGPAPGPTPPGPAPGPVPPSPNDALGQLAALACQAAKALPVDGRNEAANALAEIYTAYSAAIAQGKFTKVADVRAKIREDANIRIGYKNAVIWNEWGNKIAAPLQAYVEVGGQADIGRYKLALEALAVGLAQSTK
jgi:hypothetical protein